jgi:hypothetical protein
MISELRRPISTNFATRPSLNWESFISLLRLLVTKAGFGLWHAGPALSELRHSPGGARWADRSHLAHVDKAVYKKIVDDATHFAYNFG